MEELSSREESDTQENVSSIWLSRKKMPRISVKKIHIRE